MPTLQRLSILDTCDSPNQGEHGIHKIVISVPSLKYLNFVNFYGDLCLCENMPEVVEANVKVIYESPAKLLESLPSVKRLYLCLSTSMLHHRIGFYYLVHLELCVDSIGWDLVTWMLESSPKLQVLNVGKCEEGSCAISATESHWRGPSSVPECLLFHLHTFNWKQYSTEDEGMKIVAYILKNARQLKTASISAWKYCSKDEQSQKISELVSLPRASSSCQLVVESRKSRSILSES
uniref:Putative FBD-associated F-box protein n=1 Tax=Noccaea caerulescens TaxID=107243 RepID=A0A1J3ITT4_NOCCA